MSSRTAGSEPTSVAPPGSHTLLSVLLVAHLFFVFVALGSNYARSALTDTILTRFAPYVRLLNFDLDFTPYHLTHGTDADVDHRIEVLPQGSDSWAALPSGGFPGLDSYQRYQRFASIWAFHAANEGEPAVFAQAVGTHFSRVRATPPQQIRCRKHFQMAREDLAGGTAAQRDPDDPSRFAVAYAANAIVNSNGSVDVIRVEETGQVAVPVNSAGTTRGRNVNERSQ